ncbi:MAG TPA: hypothetical protein VKD66_16215 [Streptosporangiaceae bacterium]|nr:hypothetical protein [Streptosporangiaceae bacterium]
MDTTRAAGETCQAPSQIQRHQQLMRTTIDTEREDLCAINRPQDLPRPPQSVAGTPAADAR